MATLPLADAVHAPPEIENKIETVSRLKTGSIFED